MRRASNNRAGRRILSLMAVAFCLLSTTAVAWAQPGGEARPESVAPRPFTDPVLDKLIEESLAARPEIARAKLATRAERERVSQAGALPDPTVQLGVQNDGFTSVTIGEDPMSYVSIGAAQTFPWPGTLRLRAEAAEIGAKGAEADARRVLLSAEAEVRRAYLDLLLARERLGLLDRLEGIWKRSAEIARVRYESGDGAQSDVLRAQLELNRLRQRRWSLLAEERLQLQTLNRLRGRPLDEAIESGSRLSEAELPALTEASLAIEDAFARSPELAAARFEVAGAEKGASLARKGYLPEITVSAGVMVRGFDMQPMWQAGVGVPLPLFAGRKQDRAVAESEARMEAGAKGAEAIEQTLRLRIGQRREALRAALENIALYRQGLLVQSKATVESVLTQYQVGKASFASVLEANAGYVADEDGLLQALAEAQRIGIAEAELSLDPVGAASAAMGSTGMQGSGSAEASRSQPSAPSGSTSSSMSGM